LVSPERVGQLLRKLRRPVVVGNNLKIPGWEIVSQTWNAEVVFKPTSAGEPKHKSCLVDPASPGCPRLDLNDPTTVGDLCPPQGNSRRDLGGEGTTNITIAIRQAACPLPPSVPGGGNHGPTKTITWSSGTPSPTCKESCGKLCTGFYCVPKPTGTPPDFTPPNNHPPELDPLPTPTENHPPELDPLPTPTDKPNPPTNQPTYKIGIGLVVTDPSASLPTWTWVVLGRGSGDDVDRCGAHLYTGDSVMGPAMPPYPGNLGPFDVDGKGDAGSVSCSYEGTDTSMGTLTCGGSSRDCKKIGKSQDCDGYTVSQRFECSWS